MRICKHIAFSLMHDKEMTLAIGGDVPNEIAVIGYFFNDRD